MPALRLVKTDIEMRNEPVIDSSFQSLIPPLSSDERAGLEKDILNEGCRDALIVWKEENVLLDGHNRIEICWEHDIPYRREEMSFPSREAAESWIIGHQLNRRNLHPDQISRLRGRLYNSEKADAYARPGNQSAAKREDQNDPRESPTTADKLAAEFNVSPATIKRDASFAAACDTLDKAGVRTNEIIGKPHISKAEIIELPKKLENREVTVEQVNALAGKPPTKPKKPSDESRYGFRLMVTNQWRFPSNDGTDDRNFNGGISSGVVANLAHYFTEPGDVIVDPMAGSGRTGEVLSEIPYFSNDWEDTEAHDNGGKRKVLLSDIAPMKDGIVQADASKEIPFSGANFILLDPPYWKIAEGKYAHGGETIEEWVSWLTDVGRNCYKTLNEGGLLALVLDDYLRSQMKQPLVLLGAQAMQTAGFVPLLTVYNNYANAVATMTAIGMWRAKKAKLPLSGMKVINIFKKGELREGQFVETLEEPLEIKK